MGRFLSIAVCAVALSACDQPLAGNEMFVSVGNVWTEMEALPKADAHCRRYGKVARFNSMSPSYVASFHCVRPDQ